MDDRHKIIVLDDDVDWLALCKELLAALPSKPEILTANNAKRALQLIETGSIRLLICDLKMPRMDGLQMLTIVRRLYPELRTIVLSGMEGEEYRSRAYALGVDLFWLKNEMQRDTKLFLECIESLLGQAGDAGFRGIQSKSLMDIIQMECLSRSSTVLRITRGPLVARLWLLDGELVDAELDGARGESAFHRLLAWKSGTFENLPAELGRERTIQKPINALLLETAQNIDENAGAADGSAPSEDSVHRKTVWKLSRLAREGAEFVISLPPEGRGEPEVLGAQDSEPLVKWMRTASSVISRLGDTLEGGPVSHLLGRDSAHQMLLLPHGDRLFLVGWPVGAEGNIVEKSRKLVASWDS